MTYLYGALLAVVLYVLIKEAVAAGVKDGITSGDVDFFLSNAISRGIELHRQNREDVEPV
jgi:hypothetical protein